MSSEKAVKIKFASEEIAATHGMSTTMQERANSQSTETQTKSIPESQW
jgi:hypothetical protein